MKARIGSFLCPKCSRVLFIDLDNSGKRVKQTCPCSTKTTTIKEPQGSVAESTGNKSTTLISKIKTIFVKDGVA